MISFVPSAEKLADLGTMLKLGTHVDEACRLVEPAIGNCSEHERPCRAGALMLVSLNVFSPSTRRQQAA